MTVASPFLVRLTEPSAPVTPEQAAKAFLVSLIGTPESPAAPADVTPFRFCVASTVPAWSTVSFNNLPPFSPGAWSFPRTVPADTEFWVTDLQFASKKVRHPAEPLNMRSSYAAFNSIMTMTEHMPFVSYKVPIILPAGFVISGAWLNNSNEPQNMIAAMHGYVVPLNPSNQSE